MCRALLEEGIALALLFYLHKLKSNTIKGFKVTKGLG